jgi:hypothetical protein
MMKNLLLKYTIIATLLAVCSTSYSDVIKQGGFEYQIAKQESWVTEVNISNANESDKGTYWLLSDIQAYLSRNKASRFYHYAGKANESNGIKDISEFQVSFSPDYQKLDINNITKHRNGKTVDVTRDADIRLVQREQEYSSSIYNGSVTAMVLIPDIQVGDIVEYSYTVHGRNPIFDNKLFTGFSLNWSVPVAVNHLRLVADRQLTSQVIGKSKALLSQKQQQDLYTYTWFEKNVEAIDDEGGYPGWYTPYAYLMFSEFASWKSVADWAMPLYQIKPVENTELKALAKKWSNESNSKVEYAEKVIRYAQENIRYFGIEIGVNSHLPNGPDVVFGRKYGDCKDKTMFINTLLSIEGIKAYPALVSNRYRKAVAKDLPQPGSFDHVISTFFIDGEQYWVDGTRSFQYGKLANIPISNFEKALIISPTTKGLVDINQALKPDTIQVAENFVSDSYSKPMRLEAVFTYTYAEAESIRHYLKSQGLEVFSKDYLNYYARVFPKITMIGDVKISDNTQNNELVVSVGFSIPDYWESESEYYEIPLYGRYIHSYVEKPDIVNRTMPLAKTYPIKIKHDVKVSYPDNVNWSLNDKNIELKTQAMNYKRKITTSSNHIEINHEYVALKDSVSASHIETYVDVTNKIRDAIYYSVTINKEATEEAKQDLKSTLRSLLKRGKP